MKTGRVRLMLDFPNARSASQFVTSLKRWDLIPQDAGAYLCEALDFSPGQGGIGRTETYVILRDPAETTTRERLAVTRTETV